jgi:hypothetical protein
MILLYIGVIFIGKMRWGGGGLYTGMYSMFRFFCLSVVTLLLLVITCCLVILTI